MISPVVRYSEHVVQVFSPGIQEQVDEASIVKFRAEALERSQIMRVFGPPEAAAVLRPVLAQFADFGAVGASANSNRFLGGTDSASFSSAGLPGIGTLQDPIEYTTTLHTNLDTYERIVPDEVEKPPRSSRPKCGTWPIENRCCHGSRRRRCPYRVLACVLRQC